MSNRGPKPRQAEEYVSFKPSMPEKPEGLSEIASSKWDKIVPILFEAGAIDEGSGDSLFIMCEAWSFWLKYKKIVDAAPVAKGANDQLILHPLARERDKCLKIYMAYMDAFSLSPKTRGKVKRVFQSKARLTKKETGEILKNAGEYSDSVPKEFDNISDFIQSQIDAEKANEEFLKANGTAGHIDSQISGDRPLQMG